jgi:hypothetical protein
MKKWREKKKGAPGTVTCNLLLGNTATYDHVLRTGTAVQETVNLTMHHVVNLMAGLGQGEVIISLRDSSPGEAGDRELSLQVGEITKDGNG